MFTGIIEDLGAIKALKHSQKGALLTIATSLPLARIAIGDSIAVNGACLTVITKSRGAIAMEASAETLRRTVTETSELPTGYALTLDLSRLPADAKGLPFCVVEDAEWVDLESRCCPFLDFEISLRDKGRHITLRLTGGPDVKGFLREELGLKR